MVTLYEATFDKNDKPLNYGEVAGDPTGYISSTYQPNGILEHDINIFIVPSDMKVGASLPDSIFLHDKNDVYLEYPRYQFFNDSHTVHLASRDLPHSILTMTENHFKWSVDLEYATFSCHEDREGLYDAETGLLIEWRYNYTKSYEYFGFPAARVFHQEVVDKLVDASFLEVIG
jgi:hypothetical protein